jgi:hypothetical protein
MKSLAVNVQARRRELAVTGTRLAIEEKLEAAL